MSPSGQRKLWTPTPGPPKAPPKAPTVIRPPPKAPPKVVKPPETGEVPGVRPAGTYQKKIASRERREVLVNPRAVHFWQSTITAYISHPTEGHVSLDSAIADVLATGKLPPWPPVRVVEVTGPGNGTFLCAVEGNRRLFISRIAWQHGIIGAMRVEIFDRDHIAVAKKTQSLTFSPSGGIEVSILRKDGENAASIYEGFLVHEREFQEDVDEFLKHAMRRRGCGAKEAKDAAEQMASCLRRDYFRNGMTVDGLHRLTADDARQCGVHLQSFRDVEAALREPCAVRDALVAEGRWCAGDVASDENVWEIAGTSIRSPSGEHVFSFEVLPWSEREGDDHSVIVLRATQQHGLKSTSTKPCIQGEMTVVQRDGALQEPLCLRWVRNSDLAVQPLQGVWKPVKTAPSESLVSPKPQVHAGPSRLVRPSTRQRSRPRSISPQQVPRTPSASRSPSQQVPRTPSASRSASPRKMPSSTSPAKVIKAPTSCEKVPSCRKRGQVVERAPYVGRREVEPMASSAPSAVPTVSDSVRKRSSLAVVERAPYVDWREVEPPVSSAPSAAPTVSDSARKRSSLAVALASDSTRTKIANEAERSLIALDVEGTRVLALRWTPEEADCFSGAACFLSWHLNGEQHTGLHDTGGVIHTAPNMGHMVKAITNVLRATPGEWGYQHWRLESAEPSVLAIGVGSNKKTRERAAKLALALALQSKSSRAVEDATDDPALQALSVEAAKLITDSGEVAKPSKKTRRA